MSDKHILTIYTEGGPGPLKTTDHLRFMVGDRELDGVHDIKLGEQKGDGILGPNEVLTATITVCVRLGK